MRDRASIIDTRLTNHIHNDIEANVSTPEPTWWWNNLPGLGPWAVLGFGMPILNEGNTIVPFCPQIIEETAVDYDDDTFDQYILLIQAVIGLYIAHMDIEDRDERHDVVALELGGMSDAALQEILIQVETADFRYALTDLS